MCPVIFCIPEIRKSGNTDLSPPVVVTDVMATSNGIHKACNCVADVVATE